MHRAIVSALLLPTLALAAADPALPDWYEVQDGAWHVPPEIVAGAASHVQEAADHAYMSWRLPHTVGAYRVQYQGVEIDGKRLVRLMGACRIEAGAPDLTQRWYAVLDGGNCYYRAEYDPAAQTFVRFAFGGR